MAKSRICECCKGEFLELDMRGTLCVCCYDFIEEYQDKENKILEKALELACLSLRSKCDYCKYKDDKICPPDHHCSNLVMEYFKEQVKEIMKSE